MNRAEVQPRRDPHPHAVDADRVPILTNADDSSSSEYDYKFSADEAVLTTNGTLVHSYGSLDEDLITSR